MIQRNNTSPANTNPSYAELEAEVKLLRARVQELEKASQEQQSMGNVFQTIVDLLPVIIFWKDRNSYLLGFNKAYQESVNIPAEELFSKSAFELFPEARKYWLDDLYVIETGKAKLNIIEKVVVPGKTIWLQTDKVPYRNEAGEIVGVIGISMDITEQKNNENKIREAQQELIELNNELEKRVAERTDELQQKNTELNEINEQLKRINVDLDNFVYTASHDLKSPIANLEGLLSLLMKRLEGKVTDAERNLIDLIYHSTTKLKQTIADLTEITKVQKDLDQERVETVSFESLTEDIKVDIHELLVQSQASIMTDFQVTTIAYARKNLRSIIYNLLTNAIKYRSPDRPVHIYLQTSQLEGYTLLSVKDNGLGICPDQIHKLFSMFKRLHSHVEGTGIGLYIIKRIIENRGGKIDVHSQLGEGTTFNVYLKR